MKKPFAYNLDEAITTSNGLYIARENFSITEDTILPDGTVFKKGKKFFTMSELLLLKNAGKFPKGWDIPNGGELIDIAREFGTKNGIRHPHYLIASLGLELEGTLLNGENFDEYNKDPVHGDYYVMSSYNAGYYLGISVDGISTYMLFINDHEDGFYVAKCKYSAIGSIRLVFRDFSN